MNTEKTKKHSKYSASASSRWMTCGGSIALSEKAPPQVESTFAKEGTDAHSCLEIFLKTGPKKIREAEKFLMKTYPKEMIVHAFDAARWIWKTAPYGAEILCETKCDLSHIEPGMFGTTDAAIVEEFGTLNVIDFKYGAGIPVSPEENSQMLFYALAIAHQYEYNFERVNLTIIQPRADIDGETIRVWETDTKRLAVFGNEIRLAVRESKKKNAPLKSGDHCRFCPAQVICPELSTRAMTQAQLDFSAPVEKPIGPPPAAMKPDALAKALTALDRIDDWAKAVREHAFEYLKRGGELPGWKLVEKRSIRKWVNAEATAKLAQKKFGDAAFDRDLKSPAQLEKIAGKEFVADQSSAISSGLTLVAESDKRPASNQAEIDFKGV